jgi:hypothetical protein
VSNTGEKLVICCLQYEWLKNVAYVLLVRRRTHQDFLPVSRAMWKLLKQWEKQFGNADIAVPLVVFLSRIESKRKEDRAKSASSVSSPLSQKLPTSLDGEFEGLMEAVLASEQLTKTNPGVPDNFHPATLMQALDDRRMEMGRLVSVITHFSEFDIDFVHIEEFCDSCEHSFADSWKHAFELWDDETAKKLQDQLSDFVDEVRALRQLNHHQREYVIRLESQLSEKQKKELEKERLLEMEEEEGKGKGRGKTRDKESKSSGNGDREGHLAYQQEQRRQLEAKLQLLERHGKSFSPCSVDEALVRNDYDLQTALQWLLTTNLVSGSRSMGVQCTLLCDDTPSSSAPVPPITNEERKEEEQEEEVKTTFGVDRSQEVEAVVSELIREGLVGQNTPSYKQSLRPAVSEAERDRVAEGPAAAVSSLLSRERAQRLRLQQVRERPALDLDWEDDPGNEGNPGIALPPSKFKFKGWKNEPLPPRLPSAVMGPLSLAAFVLPTEEGGVVDGDEGGGGGGGVVQEVKGGVPPPPPPPPPPSGGPPPPPLPGMATPTLPHRPTTKKLHWDAIPRHKLRAVTIWSKLPTMAANHAELPSLFASNTAATAGRAAMQGASSSSSSSQAVKVKPLLDLRRANNIGISLSRLRYSPESLRLAILLCHAQALSLDDVLALRKSVPSAEEIEAVLAAGADKMHLYGRAEQFFFAVADVAFLPERLDAWIVQRRLPTQLEEVRDMVELHVKACFELKQCSGFLEILSIVRDVGNLLNHGQKSGTNAFRLGSLIRIADTKSVNRHTNLAHYIVKVLLDNNSNAIRFMEELPCVFAAASIPLATVLEEIATAEQHLQLMQTCIDAVQTIEERDENDLFLDIMPPFYQEATQNVRGLKAYAQKCQELYGLLCDDFGEDAEEFPPEEMFSVVQTFAKIMQQAYAQVSTGKVEFRKHGAGN